MTIYRQGIQRRRGAHSWVLVAGFLAGWALAVLACAPTQGAEMGTGCIRVEEGLLPDGSVRALQGMAGTRAALVYAGA